MAIGIEGERDLLARSLIKSYGKDREIWVKHYCSSHQILLVGEGDFSFSLSLARSFGSASNILATSLDSYDELIKKYKQVKWNLKKLALLGASILHGVDATKMEHHTDLKMRKFDRIIFNFPHAGFDGKEDSTHLIEKHKKVVHGFFRNASGMLRANGEIHVNHKTTPPFNRWNLEELASKTSLALTERVDFKAEDYQGYSNKRGAGRKSDDPFPLGECSTYKFIFSPNAKKMSKVLWSSDTAHITFHKFEGTPIETVPQPIIPYEFRQPQTNFTAYPNNIPGHFESPPTIGISNECSRRSFSHVRETEGRNDCDVYNSIHKALGLGFATNMGEVPGRGPSFQRQMELLMIRHPTASSNLEKLEGLGCTILHEFDAKTMSHDPRLTSKLFDRVVFNFPHAGFSFTFREHDAYQIELHQNVVKGFLRSAYEMLEKGGEVHITHKTAYPFDKWQIEKLAEI
ncbi:hypothetical protein Vadar_018105 [Vaccinium darrowii]|uniref:Uncharacterized protein n=1 Tax=Vaccinium darrowii TaxID=229202 RepID=A0ACB7Z5I9_9ERIC|nr:hypothetical protein Vadar_018105 [Vaccinium darrowii]